MAAALLLFVLLGVGFVAALGAWLTHLILTLLEDIDE